MIARSGTPTPKWPMDRLQNFASHKTGGLNLATQPLEDSRAPPPWMAQRKFALFWSTEFDVPPIQDEVSYDFSLYKWSGLEEPFMNSSVFANFGHRQASTT